MEDQQTGFAGLEDLRNKKNGASIDTGTLIFVCALNHKSSCIAGDYRPAVAEFQRRVTILISLSRRSRNVQSRLGRIELDNFLKGSIEMC